MTLKLVTGSARSPLEDRGDDFYQTPPLATRALLKCERLPQNIWEPACGLGAISEVLKDAGHVVHCTDLVDRGYGVGRRDFLMEQAAPVGFTTIVTNPPFKLATEFVAHGLRLCPTVIILARLMFIEGAKREAIMSRCARVHAFTKRLPMMHREGYDGPKHSNSGMAFAWFVFESDYDAGVAALRWIPREAA